MLYQCILQDLFEFSTKGPKEPLPSNSKISCNILDIKQSRTISDKEGLSEKANEFYFPNRNVSSNSKNLTLCKWGFFLYNIRQSTTTWSDSSSVLAETQLKFCSEDSLKAQLGEDEGKDEVQVFNCSWKILQQLM